MDSTALLQWRLEVPLPGHQTEDLIVLIFVRAVATKTYFLYGVVIRI